MGLNNWELKIGILVGIRNWEERIKLEMASESFCSQVAPAINKHGPVSGPTAALDVCGITHCKKKNLVLCFLSGFAPFRVV